MTLKQATKDLVASADDSVTDGGLLDMIMEELDKEHDEDNRYQGINVVGATALQKKYEAIETALQLHKGTT